MARRDDVAKARREPLDLRLDLVGPIRGGAVRHMAIRPRGVLAGRRTRRVEQRLLREQNEWARRTVVTLRLSDLRERASKVHRRRARALVGCPRDRRVERPVHLEGSRRVAVPAQRTCVRRRQRREPQQLGRHHVGEDDVRPRQLVHGGPRADDAAEIGEPLRQRVGDRLRAAARVRPADDVTERRQQEPECCRRPSLERKRGMGGVPGEEATRGLTAERCLG